MGKEKFVETINFIEKAYLNIIALEKNYIIIDDYSPYWLLIDRMIEVLSYLFNDSDLISWYCWETNFGKSDCSEIIIDEIEYICDTPEKLYDILKMMEDRD